MLSWWKLKPSDVIALARIKRRLPGIAKICREPVVSSMARRRMIHTISLFRPRASGKPQLRPAAMQNVAGLVEAGAGVDDPGYNYKLSEPGHSEIKLK